MVKTWLDIMNQNKERRKLKSKNSWFDLWKKKENKQYSTGKKPPTSTTSTSSTTSTTSTNSTSSMKEIERQLKSMNIYNNALEYYKSKHPNILEGSNPTNVSLDYIGYVDQMSLINSEFNDLMNSISKVNINYVLNQTNITDYKSQINNNYYNLINLSPKNNNSIIKFYESSDSLQNQFDISLNFKKYNDDYIFNYLENATPKGYILSKFIDSYKNPNLVVKDGILNQTNSVLFNQRNINNDYNDMIIQFSKLVDKFMSKYEITSEDVKNLFFEDNLLRSYGVNTFIIYNIIKNKYNDIDKLFPMIKTDSFINFTKDWYNEIEENVKYETIKNAPYLVFRNAKFTNDQSKISLINNPFWSVKIDKSGKDYILYADKFNKRSSTIIKQSKSYKLFKFDQSSKKFSDNQFKMNFDNQNIPKSIPSSSCGNILSLKYEPVDIGYQLVWVLNKNSCGCFFRANDPNIIVNGCAASNFDRKEIYSARVKYTNVDGVNITENGLNRNNDLFPDPLYGHYQFNTTSTSINDNNCESFNNADRSMCNITFWDGFAYPQSDGRSTDPAFNDYCKGRNSGGKYTLPCRRDNNKGTLFDHGSYRNCGVTYPYHELKNYSSGATMPTNADDYWNPDRYGKVGIRDGVFQKTLNRDYLGVQNRINNGWWESKRYGLFYKGYCWYFGQEKAYEVKSTNGLTNDKVILTQSQATTSPYSANFIQVNDDIIAIDDRIGLIYKTIIENNLDNLAKELTKEMGEWLSSQPEFLIPYRLKGYLNYVSKSRTHGNGLYTNIESPLMPGVIHVDYPILLPHPTYMANRDIEFESVKTTKGYQVINFKENSESGFDSLYTSLGSQFSTTASNSLPCLIVPNESNPINYLKDNILKISSVNMEDLQNFKNKGIGLVFETRPLTIDHQYSEDSEINKAISESNKSGSIKIKLPIVKVEENSTDVKFFYSTYGDDIKILKFVNDSYSTGVSQTSFEGGVDSLLISKNIIKNVLTLPSVFRTRYKSDMEITGY